MRSALFIGVLLTIVLLLAACAGGEPTPSPTPTLTATVTPTPTSTATATPTPTSSGPGPEETVRAYYESLTTEDLEKQISLAVPERREQIRDSLTRFGFPPGSYRDVRLETASQTEDTAAVTSKYELTTTFQGKSVEGPGEGIFGLEKRSGEWLLASIGFSEPESMEFFVDDEEGTQSVKPRCLSTTTRSDRGPRG